MSDSQTALPLKIRLFGSVEVEVRGEALPKLRSRSELWLLALLALQQDRPVSRMWLAQSLWPFPDHAADQAAYNLRRALTNLRKALGAESYRLNPLLRPPFASTCAVRAWMPRHLPRRLAWRPSLTRDCGLALSRSAPARMHRTLGGSNARRM